MSGGTTQNPPWRHHYIPEFYLKQWTGAGGQLVEFSKPYKQVVPKRRFPRQTGWEKRLYALEGVPEHLAHQFESAFFAPVDSQAADALRLMVSTGESPSGQQRVAWARFMMSLVFRTPENLRDVRARLRDVCAVTDIDSERRYRKLRRPQDPRTLSEAMLTIDDETYARRSVSFIAEMTNSQRIRNSIVRMRWGKRVLSVDVPALMTSDRPLIWQEGLDDPNCFLLMPLNPKIVFYATASQEKLVDIQLVTDRELQEYIKESVVCRAEQRVYAFGDDQLAYVTANMGTDRQLSMAARSHEIRLARNLREKRRRS